jgi:hypothetical protein
MKAPAKTENTQVFYEIEQGEGGQFGELPEWLQEKIRSSKEFSAKGASSAPQGGDTDADGNSIPF